MHWAALLAPAPDVLVPGGHGSTFSQRMSAPFVYVPWGAKKHRPSSKHVPGKHVAAAEPVYPNRQPSRTTTMATGRADECSRTMCDLRILVFGTPPRRPPTDELVVSLGGRAQVNSSSIEGMHASLLEKRQLRLPIRRPYGAR